MANEFNSKIVLSDGTVLIDLTQDDVKPENVDENIYFHDKAGKRQKGTSKKTVDASNVTAEATEVLTGRTFGKGNEVQTGTMPDNSGKDVIISNTTGTAIPIGYSDGSGVAKISADDVAKLTPDNIKQGVTILGVEGDYGADNMSSQEKTATPSFEKQTITPDPGVSFLTSVTVEAIKVDRKDNEAGGVTVTIG